MSQLPPNQHQRIKSALGKYASQRLVNNDLWPAIQQQVQTLPLPTAYHTPLYSAAPPANQPQRSPRPSLTTAAISVAVLIAIGLLTYALLPALTQPISQQRKPVVSAPAASNPNASSAPGPLMFSTPYTITEPYRDLSDQNLMTTVMSQRAQPINLSQTINGYTLTIKKVYVDANIIVVRCSYSGPNEAEIGYDTITLTSGGSAAINQGVGSTGNRKTGPRECAMDFDATSLKPITPSINLHLSANLLQWRDISSPDYRTQPKVTLAGPFVFDFNVAVIQDSRIVNVGQTVVAHGTAFTLERLIITPGETRIAVRYIAPDSNPNLQWRPVIAAEGADWATMNSDNYPRYRYSMDLKGDGAVSQLPDSSTAYQITGNLYDKVGPWTVTVKELDSYDVVSGKEQHIAGPWVFQFDVPAK